MWHQNRDSHSKPAHIASGIKFYSTPKETKTQIRDLEHLSTWIINKIKYATINLATKSPEIQLALRPSDLTRRISQRSMSVVFPEIERAKPVNVNSRETTSRKSRWKRILPDKSDSVTSRGIGYSGKYSRKSWFIAQLLEKAPRIGLSRQRQPPRWFSLSRPREEEKRENGSRSYLDKRKESAEWWTTSRTFLEIRFGGYEQVALLRPRLPSWSRNAIPVYSFKRARARARAIMIMHTMVLCR